MSPWHRLAYPNQKEPYSWGKSWWDMYRKQMQVCSVLCGSAQVNGCRAMQRGSPFALPVCRALLPCGVNPLGSLIGSRMPNYMSASMGFFVSTSNEVPAVRWASKKLPVCNIFKGKDRTFTFTRLEKNKIQGKLRSLVLWMVLYMAQRECTPSSACRPVGVG